MNAFFDDPNPSVKESVRRAVLREYLEKCVQELDWSAVEGAELTLATDTLQAILNVMQQGALSDRDALRRIDEIFAAALGHHTEKGAKLRTDRSGKNQ